MTSQPVPPINRIAEKTGTVALLVFKVENQLYGLPVTHVVRIIEMVTITSLPGAPDLIEGIINFHGKATFAVVVRGPNQERSIEFMNALVDKIHADPRWLAFLRKIGKAPEQLAKVEFKVTLPQ